MLCALKSTFPKQAYNFFRKILFSISYRSKLAKNNMKKPSVVKNDKKKVRAFVEIFVEIWV